MKPEGDRSVEPAEELVLVVDEENRPIGAVSRSKMRREGLRHRATYVLVFDGDGRIFVHKRTANKDVYPSHFDVAAGGVVLAGEDWDESAARELAEELGISGVELRFCFDFYHEDLSGPVPNRVFGRVYTCTWNGPFHLQAEEVEEGFFMPVEELFAMAEREPFCPDGLEVLRRLRPDACETDTSLGQGFGRC